MDSNESLIWVETETMNDVLLRVVFEAWVLPVCYDLFLEIDCVLASELVIVTVDEEDLKMEGSSHSDDDFTIA